MIVTVSVTPRLRARLPGLAADRSVVIDYFASARCGTVVGDITAGFAKVQLADNYITVADVDGVQVFADRTLLPLLNEAALVLDLKRLPFRPGLDVWLDRPELWLEFLDGPGVARRTGR